MKVPQDQLDQWAKFADSVRSRTATLAPQVNPVVQDALMELHFSAALVLTDMEHAGAKAPQYLPPLEDTPLHLLSSPANRRLAHVLREAYDAARLVDEERGYGDDGPAGILAELLHRVESEIHGPKGLD